MFPDLGRSIFDRFQEEGIPLLLAGGWAVGHFGHSRYTRDILDLRKILRYNPDLIGEDHLKAICLKYGGPTAYSQIRHQS